MKVKRLTAEKPNGEIVLVKEEVGFDMLSPVIAKVLTEAIEQLAQYERSLISDELIEIPYPIKSRMKLQVEGRLMDVVVAGYELSSKEMIVVLENKEGITLHIPYREAFNRLQKIGSVNAV